MRKRLSILTSCRSLHHLQKSLESTDPYSPTWARTARQPLENACWSDGQSVLFKMSIRSKTGWTPSKSLPRNLKSEKNYRKDWENCLTLRESWQESIPTAWNPKWRLSTSMHRRWIDLTSSMSLWLLLESRSILWKRYSLKAKKASWIHPGFANW